MISSQLISKIIIEMIRVIQKKGESKRCPLIIMTREIIKLLWEIILNKTYRKINFKTIIKIVKLYQIKLDKYKVKIKTCLSIKTKDSKSFNVLSHQLKIRCKKELQESLPKPLK